MAVLILVLNDPSPDVFIVFVIQGGESLPPRRYCRCLRAGDVVEHTIVEIVSGAGAQLRITRIAGLSCNHAELCDKGRVPPFAQLG